MPGIFFEKKRKNFKKNCCNLLNIGIYLYQKMKGGLIKMKWHRDTRVYCWADYYSEDGKWKTWCEEKLVESSRKKYNPMTRTFENLSTYKVWWVLQNLQTGENVDAEFKTLKAAKEFAEKEG